MAIVRWWWSPAAVVVAIAACVVVFSGVSSAYASCSFGYGECGDGTCAPLGSVCCGGGKYCDSGTICIKGGKCLPTSSPSFCGGNRYCDSGYVCTKDGKCLSMKSESYCGGRQYCDAGYLCTNDKQCMSMSSSRYCGDGKYCNPGYVCQSGGKCVSAAPASQPPSYQGSSDSGSGAPVSDSCLKVGKPRRISGMMGECTKKDGSTAHFVMTSISSTNAQGCPKSIEFTYFDSGDQSEYTFFTPFDAQICGDTPTGVHTK